MQISGATLRRWEAGLTAPDEDELRQFALVCNLSRLETEFLLRSFNARQWEDAPDDAAFRAFALGSAMVKVPAVIVDSLFYVRAWNGHFTTVAPALREGDSPHLLT